MSASIDSNAPPLIAIKGGEDDLDPITSLIERDVRIYNAVDVDSMTDIGVFIITGRTFQEQVNEEFLDHIYSSRSFLLVLPPYSDSTLQVEQHRGEAKIRSRPRSLTVRPQRQLAQHLPLEELRVVSRNIIESSIGVVLAVDHDNKPVMIGYQPTSTKGGVVISTVELAAYEMKSDETHRGDLFQAVLKYMNESRVSGRDTTTEDEVSEVVALSDTLINNALLALNVIAESGSELEDEKALKQELIREKLPVNFTFQPSDEQWDALLEYLQEKSVLTENGIRKEVLDEKIDGRRLGAYARRLT